MNPTDYGRSVIRTIVPIVVGSFIAWLAARGVKVDEATILPAIDAIVAGAYYALIRLVEHKYPKAGWLLGSPGAPSYAPSVAPVVSSVPVGGIVAPAVVDSSQGNVAGSDAPIGGALLFGSDGVQP
jgi:hypothetical protein